MDAPASLCEPFVCGTNANSLRVVLPRSKEIGQVLQRHKGMFEVQRLGVGQTVESAGAGPGKGARCSDGRGTERKYRGTKQCGDIGEQTTRAVCRWCPLPPPLWPPLHPPRLPLPLLCFTGRPAALLLRIRIIVPRRPAILALPFLRIGATPTGLPHETATKNRLPPLVTAPLHSGVQTTLRPIKSHCQTPKVFTSII